ncbi:MAG: hypothetical protein CFH44_00457 [Proteobacteria bacterium]|nr:MAG: hypothetical protein CFH44_00457 [Pseudomonadota bacterium]|tara:strand:- start:309 stop:569 length:261 start_codon:yes stop_codon:yes gene_type:complete
MSNLSLVLMHKWYDLIESGEKTSEYREIKPYWDKRLAKHYDTVTFQRGYTQTKLKFKIISIGKTNLPTDLGSDQEYYEIKLGERIY